MKRAATTVFALMIVWVASAALTAPAFAALRATQVPVLGGFLQAYLNSVGESINVNAAQDATMTWSHTTSGTTTYTIMNQGTTAANAAVQVFGLYNGGDAVPTLRMLMLGVNGPQSFCTATFKPGNIVIVNRFDALANLIGLPSTYNLVDPTNFGFYLTSALGTLYTQDARNAGGKAQGLAYQGTGANAGAWWLCWEESVIATGSDKDYDDLVVFMESVNPTPVSSTTWGAVKQRFR